MEQSIGALWVKDSKRGKFYTGNIEVNGVKVSIVVFKNSYKTKDNQPDLRIYESVWQDKIEVAADNLATKPVESRVFEDDIPF